MNESELIDRYIDALNRDPNAAPPPDLDADTAAFVRALVRSEQRSAPGAPAQDRVWHRAMSLAENPPPSNNNHRPSSRGDHIEQRVTLLKSNESVKMEDADMDMYLSPTFIGAAPGTRPPRQRYFWQYTLTMAAAILVLIFIGGLLIEMVSEPIDGYPAIAIQTEAPQPCAADTVTDLTAESTRLAEAAMTLLQKRAEDQTPEMVEQAALLALCAMQTAQTTEADAALLRALRLSESLPHVNGIMSIFSPDGRFILTMTLDETVMRLWDVATGEEIRQFAGHPGSDGNLAFAFSPDSSMIFSTGGDDMARLWDVATGEEIRQFEGAVTGRWESAIFSPDGKYVLAGVYTSSGAASQAHSVLMWDVQTGEEVRSFVSHTNLIFSIGVSPDGRYLATTSFDNSVRLWDMETGEEVRRFASYPIWTYGAAFSPDGQFLLSGGGGRYTRLLNVETGETVREFEPNISLRVAGRVDYSPDGRLIATGGPSGWAVLWNAETGDLLRNFFLVADQMDSLAFSPDGKYLMTSTNDNVTRLWPVSIEDTVALACSKLGRDFTPEERAQYGLGEGAACSITNQ